jgi:hypothetical protein
LVAPLLRPATDAPSHLMKRYQRETASTARITNSNTRLALLDCVCRSVP